MSLSDRSESEPRLSAQIRRIRSGVGNPNIVPVLNIPGGMNSTVSLGSSSGMSGVTGGTITNTNSVNQSQRRPSRS